MKWLVALMVACAVIQVTCAILTVARCKGEIHQVGNVLFCRKAAP